MTDTVQAQVSIRVTVQIDAGGGPWSADHTMQQAHDQGSREAMDKLHQMLQGKAKIVGDPEVLVVIMTKKKS